MCEPIKVQKATILAGSRNLEPNEYVNRILPEFAF